MIHLCGRLTVALGGQCFEVAIPLLTAAVGKEELDAHTAVFVAASVDCDSSRLGAARLGVEALLAE